MTSGSDIISTEENINLLDEGGVMVGGDGNDRLLGGEGKDIFIGNKGNDIYTIIPSNNDHDVIIGFEVNNPFEKIDIQAFSYIKSFSDLKINQEADGSALIDLSNNQTFKIHNVSPASLSENNFILISTDLHSIELPTS